MNAYQHSKKYAIKNRFYLIFPVLFAMISLVLIISNGSFIFEYDFINRYGDQNLYYKLAYNLAKWEFPKSPYTLGYPLMYLPFIIVTGIRESWTSIMNFVIPLQAFILIPSSIFLIMKDKTKKWALVTLGLMVGYYFVFLLKSEDILIKYNVLGLIPLSEPLAVSTLITSYWIYLRYLKVEKPKIAHIVLFAGLFSISLLTRNTSLILFLPIFVDLLIDKRLRQVLYIGILAAVFYAPQLIYNYMASKDVLFNGYVWWASNKVEKNTNTIEAIYGVRSSAMFSMQYFAFNITHLLVQYLPLVALCFVNLFKKSRFVSLVVVFSMLNLVFYLSYWWSGTGDLLYRFLLPNIFLLLFIFKNNLIKDEK